MDKQHARIAALKREEVGKSKAMEEVAEAKRRQGMEMRDEYRAAWRQVYRPTGTISGWLPRAADSRCFSNPT